MRNAKMAGVTRCEYCGAGGPLECDHIVPLAFGGADDVENMQALCVECHGEKTRRDQAAIAKMERIRRKAQRGEPTGRLYRGVDGQVRRRR